MNTFRLIRFPFCMVLVACVFFALLLGACQPVAVPHSLPPEQATATSIAEQLPTATQTPLPATQIPSLEASGDITLDLSGVAPDQTVETVAAVPASAGGPSWEVTAAVPPVTLQGYPVNVHSMKPQIFIYSVADLAATNEAACRMVTDLQALLQARQPVDRMPFLPLFNVVQVMHAQVQYLDFKNGKGVRFLTQFDQASLPINNIELIYTFQGLTNDGKNYIAAVLPVTHPDLPANQQVSAQQAAEMKDFPAYLAKTVTWLDQQPGSSFTPDLAKLDALIQSIEVK